MADDRRCPRCSKPLPPDFPTGTCPACLLRAGLEPAYQAAPLDDSANEVAAFDLEPTSPGRVLESLARSIGSMAIPTWSRAEIPQMPKGRYRIMTAYMPKVGGHGLDMMYRTCTVQTNLDYSGEADMVKKLRVSLALQPVATAMFANSPFKIGRAHV